MYRHFYLFTLPFLHPTSPLPLPPWNSWSLLHIIACIYTLCACVCVNIYIYIYNIVNTFSFAYMWVCECLFRADHLILDKLWGHLSLKETDSSLNRHLPPTSLCVGVETCGIFLFSIGMPFDAVIILICFSQPHCLEFLYTIYFELY